MKQSFIALFGILIGLFSQAQEVKIQSKHFETERTIEIFVPEKVTKEKESQVIYVFDAQWKPYFQMVTSTINYLIEANEYPPCVIVGIHAENRSFELTPESVNDDWKVPSLGGAKKLEGHLRDEVFPYISENYVVSPFRVGIGHSLGGTFMLNSLVDAPDLFNAYIAVSPNLQLDESEISLKIQRNLKELKSENKFVYASIGTEGNVDQMFLPFLKDLNKEVTKLESASFHWNCTIDSSYNHGTSPLAGIHKGLLTLSDLWKLSKDDMKKIAKQEDSVRDLNTFFNHLSKWMGYEIVPSKDDYYLLGDCLEEEKEFDKAMKVYQGGGKTYPENSRMWNRLADCLKELGMKKDARLYYTRALEKLEGEKAALYAGDYDYFKALYQKNLDSL